MMFVFFLGGGGEVSFFCLLSVAVDVNRRTETPNVLYLWSGVEAQHTLTKKPPKRTK